jgi:hypothetical protein
MAEPIWRAVATDWSDVEQTNGQVKVSTLHWRVSLTDGDLSSSSYGTTPPDQPRVYTLAALEAVPESVVVKWILDALGPEEVARIEKGLADDIVEQKTPTSGSVNY